MLKKGLRVIFPILIFSFLIWNIVSRWNEVLPYIQEFRVLPLLICFCFLLLIYPESAYAWNVLLRRLGIKADTKKVMYVWIISNTSRYIPGTVWQYLGRIELGQRIGIGRKEGIASVLAEVFFVMVSAAMVSLLTVHFWDFLEIENSWKLLMLIIPFLFLLHPGVALKLMKIVAKVSNKDFDPSVKKLNFKDYFSILPWFVANFIINGIALFFLTQSLGVELSFINLIEFSGFYALSWLVGYLTIIAPGGFGATEASLTFLLAFVIPLSVAAVIALLYRFLLMLAETIVFLAVHKISISK